MLQCFLYGSEIDVHKVCINSMFTDACKQLSGTTYEYSNLDLTLKIQGE